MKISFSGLLLLSAIAIVMISLSFSAISFAAYNTTTMNVSIQAVGLITLQPTFIGWWDLGPGSTGGTQTVEIQNIGSINVTDIYAYYNTLTVEPTRPYQSDDAASYASGDVIVMRNQSETKLYFNGRIEWNWTNIISNIVLTNVPNAVAWGFFKNVTNEYVWAIGNGTGGFCNDTTAHFGIDDDIDTGVESTRTPEITDFTTPDNVGADWSVFSIDRTGSPLYGHCVAVWVNCTKIYIYKYDYRGQFPNCNNRGYIEDVITPSGETEILTLDAWIPKGLPNGNMSSTILTVYTS
jgi:hypothetical protein